MLKAVVIAVIVIAVLVGGLLTLRNSTRTGMPGEDVLRRAKQRELELKEAQKDRKDR